MTVFKSGDLVVLKSGGPVMTVDTVNTDIFDDDKITGVLCAWFVGNKLERARFDCNAIAPAPQEASSELRPQEAAAEYGAVLDDMTSAMNDPVEASGEVSRAPLTRRKQVSRQPSKRASARKDTTEATAPVPREMN